MLPCVWLLGASGVGKSTVGYRMLTDLDAAGVPAAFVDADQLRLASGLPVSATDLVASALPALGRGYRAHGARALVVAGLADDRDHLTRLLPGVPRRRVLAVQLDADGDATRARVHRRGWRTDLADDAVRYAARIDPTLADLRVDTTNRSPDDVAARVTGAALDHLRQATHDGDDVRCAAVTPRRVVAVTGPGAVGASTVGYQTFARLARAGTPVRYLDAHQLGLVGTETHRERLAPLRAANVRSLAGYGGAETVVVSGDADTVRRLEASWDDETLTTFWLHASANALAARVTARARGAGPPLPGDQRAGLTGPALADAVAATVRESRRADLRPVRARYVDTSDLDAAGTAGRIVASLAERP